MLHVHKILEHLEDPQIANYYSEAIDRIDKVAKGLRQSAKFDLGDFTVYDGEQGDTTTPLFLTGQEMAAEGLFSLPFPFTYYEATFYGQRLGGLFVGSDGSAADIGQGDADLVGCTMFDPTPRGWALRNNTMMWCPQKMTCAFNRIVQRGPDDLTEEGKYQLEQDIYALLYVASALLSQTAVTLEVEDPPVKLNKSRKERGKPPLYSHHVVKIKGFSNSGRITNGGTHASPRKHWRRGHVRVLRRGLPNEKKTLIPACLINGRGFVSKEYEVVT